MEARYCEEHINKGQAALMAVFVVMTIMLSAIFGVSALSLKEHAVASENTFSQNSFYAAEAGVDDAVYRFKRGKNISSSFSLSLNGASSDVTISSLSPTIREITAVGDASSRTRTLKAQLSVGAGASFSFALQSGAGGINLGNGASIMGNVFSNGSIDGANNASTTGDVYVAGAQIAMDRLYETQNDNYDVGKVSPIIDVAQSFIPTVSGNISQVSIYLRKAGTPANRDVDIVTSSGGSPTKTVVAAGTINSDQVTTQYGWINVPLSSTPHITAGTQYWIIIDSSQSNSNYYTWGIDTLAGNSVDVSKYSPSWNASSPSWSAISGDLNYRVWLGGAINTVNNLEVGGDLHANTATNVQVHGNAYYQNIDQSSLDWLNSYSVSPGVAFPGSADPPTQGMPISDAQITAFKQAAENGGVYNGTCPYRPVVGLPLGPIRINCDLVTSNSQSFIIKGPVWVNGNITFANSNVFVLDPSYGTASDVIIADMPTSSTTKGVISAGNGFATCGSTGYDYSKKQCNPFNGSFLMLISGHTGNSPALSLSNGVDGIVFYAPAGELSVGNGIVVKAATAYKLTLGNGASIKYDTGLANLFFTSGATSAWSIDSWQEIAP